LNHYTECDPNAYQMHIDFLCARMRACVCAYVN